ncbi:hypothetical protein IRJ41_017987, partial [Triplophysa rosa]
TGIISDQDWRMHLGVKQLIHLARMQHHPLLLHHSPLTNLQNLQILQIHRQIHLIRNVQQRRRKRIKTKRTGRNPRNRGLILDGQEPLKTQSNVTTKLYSL